MRLRPHLADPPHEAYRLGRPDRPEWRANPPAGFRDDDALESRTKAWSPGPLARWQSRLGE